MDRRIVGWLSITAGAVVFVASVVALPSGGMASSYAVIGIAAALGAAVFGSAVVLRAASTALSATNDPDAARRSARRLSWMLAAYGFLVPIAVLIGVGPTVISGVPLRTSQYVMLAAGAVALAGGITLVIALSRSRGGAIVDPEPAPVSVASGDQWLIVTPRDPGAMVLYGVSSVVLALLVSFSSLRLLVVAIDSGPAGWAIALVVMVVLLVVAVWWLRRRFPQVSVNPGKGVVRAGAREVPVGQLTAARLVASVVWPGGPRTLFLTLEGPDGFEAPLLLRRGGRLAMTDAQRGAAVAAVRAAPIRLPHAREDPQGKFSRVTHPSHVDAEQAALLVESPPRDGDELPVSMA